MANEVCFRTLEYLKQPWELEEYKSSLHDKLVHAEDMEDKEIRSINKEIQRVHNAWQTIWRDLVKYHDLQVNRETVKKVEQTNKNISFADIAKMMEEGKRKNT